MKTKHYFLTHPINVLANFPLQQVLQKSDASVNSLIELTALSSSLDRKLKGKQSCTRPGKYMWSEPQMRKKPESKQRLRPDCHKVRFSFHASNNEGNYKAMVLILKNSKDLEIKNYESIRTPN